MAKSRTFVSTSKYKDESEDALLSVPEKGIYIVADGLSGYNGAISSRKAVESARSGLESLMEKDEWNLESIKDIVFNAHEDVVNLLDGDNYIYKVGSTISLGLFHDDSFWWASVGDSPIYALHHDNAVSMLNPIQEKMGRNMDNVSDITSLNCSERAVLNSMKHLMPGKYLGSEQFRRADINVGTLELDKVRRIMFTTDGVSDLALPEEIDYALRLPSVDDTILAMEDCVRRPAYIAKSVIGLAKGISDSAIQQSFNYWLTDSRRGIRKALDKSDDQHIKRLMEEYDENESPYFPVKTIAFDENISLSMEKLVCEELAMLDDAACIVVDPKGEALIPKCRPAANGHGKKKPEQSKSRLHSAGGNSQNKKAPDRDLYKIKYAKLQEKYELQSDELAAVMKRLDNAESLYKKRLDSLKAANKRLSKTNSELRDQADRLENRVNEIDQRIPSWKPKKSSRLVRYIATGIAAAVLFTSGLYIGSSMRKNEIAYLTQHNTSVVETLQQQSTQKDSKITELEHTVYNVQEQNEKLKAEYQKPATSQPAPSGLDISISGDMAKTARAKGLWGIAQTLGVKENQITSFIGDAAAYNHLKYNDTNNDGIGPDFWKASDLSDGKLRISPAMAEQYHIQVAP